MISKQPELGQWLKSLRQTMQVPLIQENEEIKMTALTLDMVARSTQIRLELLSKIENGLVMPDFYTVHRLCQEYGHELKAEKMSSLEKSSQLDIDNDSKKRRGRPSKNNKDLTL